jgi:hypothetical protein
MIKAFDIEKNYLENVQISCPIELVSTVSLHIIGSIDQQ